MERDDLEEPGRGIPDDRQTLLSDNACLFASVPEAAVDKWTAEKARYDEVIEYIRQVDEILDLMRPFPRDPPAGKREDAPLRRDSRGLDHLENIIRLVQQLKELRETAAKAGDRTSFVRDLKRLREHKRRLKNEEMEFRTRARARSTPEESTDLCPLDRKSSSTSEKLDGWREKRKSLSLETKAKVSKWTKVKEAFHWERTSALKDAGREHSPDDLAASALDGFSPPPPPPPPPAAPRPEDFLSVGPPQDLPSSSSSDRLEELLSFSEAASKGIKTPEPDSPGRGDDEEVADLRRKSSSDELTLAHHLCKEEFGAGRSGKANKTTWGKVKDIIQTRKDSLKKKPKKRGSDEFKKRRKLSTLSNPQLSDQFEDLSSPEEKAKGAEIIPKITYEFSEDPPQAAGEEKCSRKSTPALTVTLPSTEELRSFCFDDVDKKEAADEAKAAVLGQFSCQAHYCEDKSKFAKAKSGQNQRLSRWIKVKRVFLTSSSPPRLPQYLPGSSSSPTSQNKSSGFFSDLESDDLSSGEWIEDKSPSQEKPRPGFPDPQAASMALIQEDIRKSYNELQKKLSQEFDQKLREWEIKNEPPPKPEEPPLHPKGRPDEGDCIPKFRKTRDSIAVPLPNLNDLSPEFKKKLNDWKKMKTSQSSSSVSSSATKEEMQGQNIKIRIGEWQPWKTRCSQKGAPLAEDYSKGGGSRPPATRGKDEEGGSACSTARRGSKRRDSVKKLSHSRTSSGGESLLSVGSTDKDGRFIRRSQKVKDFQWVEKELQKIEREKLRLDQEKEKYLEREARLEKMKRTMGTACPTQEVLVRTPEGFFRFKGISHKFTKKLYEWEKARGIAPEASTFALLEESARSRATGDAEGDGGAVLQRSKSTGSVPELSSALLIQTMAHHPSSLSLNDVDDLKTRDEDESISSEQIKDEPEAIIVDVEDIIEETALLAEGADFKREQPVYTYAPEEVQSGGRFYFSGDFGVRVMGEADQENQRRFDTRQQEPTAYSGSRENTPPEVPESYDDGGKLPKAEDTRKLQEGQESKGAPPEDEKAAGAPVPERKREKTEVQEVARFSPWADKGGTARHLYSDGPGQGRADPEALKKKIKEKITLMQRMTTDPGWRPPDSEPDRSRESVSVFVPTTRKIISPVRTTQGATLAVCSYVIDDVKTEEPGPGRKLPDSKSASPVLQARKNDLEAAAKRDIGMPPLPNSPKFVKKASPKEAAPSIRMIIAKYNQKISERDGPPEKRPESGSPIWRSPVFGRRTQEKIEKFDRKDDEGRKNGEVQKSASLDNVRSKKSPTPPRDRDLKGILKSSSAGVVKIPLPEPPKETSPSVLRALKIQKAKEEFLSGRLGRSGDASAAETPATPPPRLPQPEEEPEQNLIKSVSAETIGGESSGGEKTPDRPLQKSSSKFDISSIKSRFRKIRMRREKETKLNAVAILCRQSLFIEVPKSADSGPVSKSCPSSPVMERNNPPADQ